MKIVASSQLGKVGAAEGKPAFVEWRWFDSKPTLALWIALAAMLVVPRQNRNRYAWLILVVPLLALPLRLFYLMPMLGSSAGFDLFIQVIVSFTIAWAIVWLAVPYFPTRNRWQAFFAPLAVMHGVGLLAYLGYFGFWIEFPTPVMVICLWCVGTVSLLAALQLSGICCGGRYHTGKIALWLLLWIPIVTIIGMTIMFASIVLTVEEPRMDYIPMFLVQILIMSAFVSAVLYVVNLPILLLAGLTDCCRDRLRAWVCRCSPVQPSLAGGNPFGE